MIVCSLRMACLLGLLGCASGPSSPFKVQSCADAHALAAKSSPVHVLVYFKSKDAVRRGELDAVLGASGYEPLDEVGDATLIEVDDDGISKLCASERIEQLSSFDPYQVSPAWLK